MFSLALVVAGPLACTDDHAVRAGSSGASAGGSSQGDSGSSETGGNAEGQGDGDGDAGDASVLLEVTPFARVHIGAQTFLADAGGFVYLAEDVEDIEGVALGELPDRFVVKVEAPGFAPQVLTVESEAIDDLHRVVELVELDLPIGVDNQSGGTVSVEGATLELPPDAFVDDQGVPIVGIVDVTLEFFDPTIQSNESLPAALTGKTSGSDLLPTPLESTAMGFITAAQGGEAVFLSTELLESPRLTLMVPDALVDTHAPGDEVPNWTFPFDEDEPVWVEESMGVIVEEDGQLLWRAPIETLGWHNADHTAQPEDFECYVLELVDQHGEPVTRGFGIRAVDDGIYLDSGMSVPLLELGVPDYNFGSNCVEAPLDAEVLLELQTEGSISFEAPIMPTGDAGLCMADGVPTQGQCQLVRGTIMVEPEEPCTLGEIDEGCVYTGPVGTEGVGLCTAGERYCLESGEWSSCSEWVPVDASEQCEPLYAGLDADCDVDDEPVCTAPADAGASFDCSPTKQLHVAIEPDPSASYYRIFEYIGGLGAQIGETLGAMPGELSLTVPLHQLLRGEADYVAQACNALGCADAGLVLEDANVIGGVGMLELEVPDEDAAYGWRVALSGDGRTMAASAPKWGEDTGFVEVFVWSDEGDWVREDLDADGLGLSDEDFFGLGLALSGDGDRLLIGASGRDVPANNAGRVYLFERGQDGWTEVPGLESLECGNGHQCGRSVAMNESGTMIAVGAQYAGPQSEGEVHLWREQQGSWMPHGDSPLSADVVQGWFGSAVALSESGAVLVVGATGEGGEEGAAYVYTLVDDQWIENHRLVEINPQSGAHFGASVAANADGSVILVGAPDGAQGRVHVYEREGDAWSHSQPLTANGLLNGHAFGTSVGSDGSGTRLFAGAPGFDGGQGALFVFTKQAGSWAPEPDPLTLPDGHGGAAGTSGAFDLLGRVLLIGSPEAASGGVVSSY